MSATRLPAANHRAQPWKNGLGISYTIADFPQGAGFDVVDWQVGHTDIGVDCPFSNLPGVDRLFMVIEGKGVELTCTDDKGMTTTNRVEALQAPFAFRGEWPTTCRLLDGPVKVFNVMTRRSKFAAVVRMLPFSVSEGESPEDKLIAVAFPSLDAWILDGSQPDIGRGVLVRIRRR